MANEAFLTNVQSVAYRVENKLRSDASEAFDNEYFEIAAVFLNKAININPRNAQLFSDRSRVKIKLNDFIGAIVDANRAIALKPYCFEGYLHKGTALIKLGDYPGAKECFEKGAALLSTPTFTHLIQECDEHIAAGKKDMLDKSGTQHLSKHQKRKQKQKKKREMALYEAEKQQEKVDCEEDRVAVVEEYLHKGALLLVDGLYEAAKKTFEEGFKLSQERFADLIKKCDDHIATEKKDKKRQKEQEKAAYEAEKRKQQDERAAYEAEWQLRKEKADYEATRDAKLVRTGGKLGSSWGTALVRYPWKQWEAKKRQALEICERRNVTFKYTQSTLYGISYAMVVFEGEEYAIHRAASDISCCKADPLTSPQASPTMQVELSSDDISDFQHFELFSYDDISDSDFY